MESSPADVRCGIPNGSVIGPFVFILYTQQLLSVIDHRQVSRELYADDTQIYKSSHPTAVNPTIQRVEKCISDVKSCTTCNKLLMNDDNTGAILITIHNFLIHIHYIKQYISATPTLNSHSPYKT